MNEDQKLKVVHQIKEDEYFRHRSMNLDFSTISVIFQVLLFHSTQISESFNQASDACFCPMHDPDLDHDFT